MNPPENWWDVSHPFGSSWLRKGSGFHEAHVQEIADRLISDQHVALRLSKWFSQPKTVIQWIGLRENRNRKPWFLPLNMGVSRKFSLKPIHWVIESSENGDLSTHSSVKSDSQHLAPCKELVLLSTRPVQHLASKVFSECRRLPSHIPCRSDMGTRIRLKGAPENPLVYHITFPIKWQPLVYPIYINISQNIYIYTHTNIASYGYDIYQVLYQISGYTNRKTTSTHIHPHLGDACFHIIWLQKQAEARETGTALTVLGAERAQRRGSFLKITTGRDLEVAVS